MVPPALPPSSAPTDNPKAWLRARAEQRVPSCPWFFSRPWPHTPLIFQASPEKLKETEGKSEPQSPAPQNFSKLTELYSKRELLLGRAQRIYLIQPVHSQRCKLKPREVSPSQGHTATSTRIQEPGEGTMQSPAHGPQGEQVRAGSGKVHVGHS